MSEAVRPGGPRGELGFDSISFGVDEEPIKRILMAEPLKGSRVHVEELLANSPTAAELVKNLRA